MMDNDKLQNKNHDADPNENGAERAHFRRVARRPARNVKKTRPDAGSSPKAVDDQNNPNRSGLSGASNAQTRQIALQNGRPRIDGGTPPARPEGTKMAQNQTSDASRKTAHTLHVQNDTEVRRTPDTNRDAGPARRTARADDRVPVSNPRDQLRRMRVDAGGEPKGKTAAGGENLPSQRPGELLPARAVSAPLPREIEYSAPEINPDTLRRSASERQRGQSANAAVAAQKRTELAAVRYEAARTTVGTPHPSKPLPQKSSRSAQGTKHAYKRADDFLPEKPLHPDARRMIPESEKIGYIEGRDVLDGPGEADDSPPRSGALSSLLKAIVYIVFILTLSGFLSYFAISIGNDIFAFVKSSDEVTVTVPEYATIDNIAELLASKGLIKYPFIFKIYAMLRKDDGDFVAGDYAVSPSMSYDQLRYALKGTVKEREEISITIPEGYTVDEIIDLFVNTYGMGTREGFVNAIQNEDYDYWFLDDLDVKEGRKYRLEGYLYPDTYYFFTDWTEKNIITKLLNNFESKFDESYKARCEELGMTVDELITLASMVEMEGKFTDEYGAISAVFHNRLDNPSATNGKLESDATIQYILPERHEELTEDDLAINSPYNTYMYAGLPAGPISNPALDAIHSAMYPDDVDYYYFVAQPNGRNLFAQTYAEHLANKQEVAEEKAEANG